MPRKNVLLPYKCFNAASMTGTSTLTSTVSNVQWIDNISIQLQWTGTPNGTFYVQGSLDYLEGTGGTVLNAGTWTNLDLPSTPVASGAAGQILINISSFAPPFIRVQYTNSSSTGTLTGYVCGKEL